MKNYKALFILLTLLNCFNKISYSQTNFNNQLISKTVVFSNETMKLNFVNNQEIFSEGWDTLPQPRFWQDVICLSPDSCIINVAATRFALDKVTNEEWKCQQDSEKDSYRECLKKMFGLDDQHSIYVTSGKRDFYEYKKVIPMINTATGVFVKNNVDPWYAQTILLIESPGKSTQKSSVGAYGPFQLMRSVARKYGLRINKHEDQRTDLSKAAMAAAKLLGNSFIPKVKEMLDGKNIKYNETDLWFRLLVMHAYHAGPGNVNCVLNELNPTEGGISLFTKIWQTECNGFKNESQNYSQIALASLILFDKIINQEKDTVFMVQGDRMLSKYKTGLPYNDANNFLNACMRAYANDLLDGTISFEYFIKKVGILQKEIVHLDKKNPDKNSDMAIVKRNPLNQDQFLKLGDQLLKKKKVEEAIKVFKLNVEQNPNSPLAYDSLSRAYQMLGKKDLAIKYINKSTALKNGIEISR